MSDDEIRVRGTGVARPRPPPNRRRDKPQLSCSLCRRRKLKCDRTQPCANCMKRGLGPQCIYPVGNATTESARQGPPPGAATDAHERLRQLEDQVVTMIHRREPTEGTTDSVPLPTPAESNGSTSAASPLDVDPEGFRGPAFPDCYNWASILRELRKRSSNFECAPKQRTLLGEPHKVQTTGPLLLYGCLPARSHEELLSVLPPRELVNRLISVYFNGLDLSSAIIHGPEFLKEYDNFWKSPEETSPIWLALLYGMLCIAVQFQMANPENSLMPDEALSSSFGKYRERLVQCLILGRYTDGGPHVMQAMMHYLVVELFDTKDANTGVWVVLGIMVNIANRMGYHRDPSSLPRISCYEGEMRRRLWRSIIVLDSAISESVGMQRLVCDTGNVQEPRNLLDSDFDANTTVLPTPRPDTEPTPMLYCLAKGRALGAFGIVTDLVTASQPCSYSKVMKVDNDLMKSHSDIPTSYKWRDMSQQITDSPQIICRRMYLEVVYLKARVVLHLKYVMALEDKENYAYSHRTILEAVSQLLSFHHICDEETKPSGQLFSARWRYVIAVHQNFLLANIAACFYLEHNRSTMDSRELESLKSLCRKSQGIWIRASRSSTEAAKVAEALRISLDDADDPTTASEVATDQSLLLDMDTAPDTWTTTYLPDYFGGFDLPFAYVNLFDGLAVPEPIGNAPDSLLVPPVAGQSAEYLVQGAWGSADQE